MASLPAALHGVIVALRIYVLILSNQETISTDFVVA